ncbi:MAG: alpha/beta hydrolase [Polyangiaceae bacterium]|nr:alpha/beta hydrolase [Polyangiaceae bacterium]
MTQGQTHLPETGRADTLNTNVVPVILVPGVMGTRLFMRGAGPNWDPANALEMLKWVACDQRRVAHLLDAGTPADIAIDLVKAAQKAIVRREALIECARRSLPPGTSSTVSRVYTDRGWGQVVWGFYGPVLMELEERLNMEGSGSMLRPVYAVGYDWRQSNRNSGRHLINRIRAILARHPPAQRAIIVSHSMGGLVTRSALRDGADQLLVGVVHTVMPSDGATVAYRRFQTGAVAAFDANGFFDIPSHVLRGIMGTTRLEYAVTQARSRGPLELLPADTYPEPFVTFQDGTTNRNVTDIFNEYLRQDPPGIVPRAGEHDPDQIIPTAPPVGMGGAFPGMFEPIVIPGFRAEQADVDALSRSLRQARDFLRFLHGPAPTAHPRTIVLLGDEHTTDLTFNWQAATPNVRDRFNAKVGRGPRGDGTVPAASAEFRDAAPAPTDRGTYPVEHAACFADPVFRLVVELGVRRQLSQVGVFPPTAPPPPPPPTDDELDGGVDDLPGGVGDD